jgi:menaquinone-dependent protoporphyrinogen oxidase
MSHVLVAYATKHGSTEAIATAIAERLNACGVPATSVEASRVPSLEPYDAVVLGSAVYARRWRAEARHFMRRHASELARKPFWVFSSGPVGDPANDNPAWEEPAHTIAKALELGARDHAVFGGALPAEPHGMMMRSMARNTPAEFRDRRDWDEIRTWTDAIADALRVPA